MPHECCGVIVVVKKYFLLSKIDKGEHKNSLLIWLQGFVKLCTIQDNQKNIICFARYFKDKKCF